MKKNAKLAPLQTSLRHVAILFHNADFPNLRVTKTRQIHPRRQMASRWELAKCYFYHISGFRSFGNGLGYVSPSNVSVSSFLACFASSGFCKKSRAVRAMILAA